MRGKRSRFEGVLGNGPEGVVPKGVVFLGGAALGSGFVLSSMI